MDVTVHLIGACWFALCLGIPRASAVCISSSCSLFLFATGFGLYSHD